jgi:signal transduction histidine kinase
MTEIPRNAVPRSGVRFLHVGFAVVVFVLLIVNLLAIVGTSRLEANNRALVEDLLRDYTLVARVHKDMDDERLLLDAHIFEKEGVNMKAIEAELDANRADLDAALRAYEPVGASRPEWATLKEDVAALRRASERVLELSRRDDDDAARAIMVSTEPQFLGIARTTEALRSYHFTATKAALDRLAESQRAALAFSVFLTLVGMAFALAVAITVSRTIRRRQEELSALARALEAKNRELDAFAGRVAHDLRGPLSTVSLAASTLAERAPEEQKATAAIMKRGLGRADALIEDLLALSRLESEARDARCDPSPVAAAVRDEVAPLLEREGGALRLEVDAANVSCSDGLLRQALRNVVENAVKYHRPDVPPQIELRGRAAGEHYELRVEDNGIGMKPEEIEHAFEPFYRAKAARKAPGTGLGLSIVRRIVEAHHGSVRLESRPSVGTTTIIELSLASEHASSTSR